MSDLTIVTNNFSVRDKFERDGFGVEFVDGTPMDVMERTLVLLQESYRLVSTPLPPNVPMMRAPFRSLLIERSAEKYDIPGIEALEKARKTMARQRAITSEDMSTEPDEKSEDFAQIDATYLERAMRDYATIKDD